MKNLMLNPTKEWHSNASLSGREFQNVSDLPITRLGDPGIGGAQWQGVLSVWKVPFWRRFLFLFDGRVNFVCMSTTHPPVSITVGDYFEKEDQ